MRLTGLFILGLLVWGTLTAITAKTQFTMKITGSQTCSIIPESGGEAVETLKCYFNKPWFETLAMFSGMSICLLIFAGDRMMTSNKKQNFDIQYDQKEQTKTSTVAMYILIPAVFDLVGTTLSGIGLLWVAASIYQMLRGSLLVFAALLSVRFLRKKLYGFHWFAIGLSILALCFVGGASIAQESGEDGNATLEILGIVFVVLGQLVQASQIVTEEFLLRNLSAPPMLIVGMEGIWGVIVTVAGLAIMEYLPPSGIVKFAANGACKDNCMVPIYHEDSIDTLTKLTSDDAHALRIVICVYLLAIVLYNICGMKVTQHLSAGHRTILEACRTLCIWIADLFIYYVLDMRGSGSPGEAWTTWSWCQLFGFTLLVAGTFVYNKIVRLPGFYYPEDEPQMMSDVRVGEDAADAAESGHLLGGSHAQDFDHRDSRLSVGGSLGHSFSHGAHGASQGSEIVLGTTPHR